MDIKERHFNISPKVPKRAIPRQARKALLSQVQSAKQEIDASTEDTSNTFPTEFAEQQVHTSVRRSVHYSQNTMERVFKPLRQKCRNDIKQQSTYTFRQNVERYQANYKQQPAASHGAKVVEPLTSKTSRQNVGRSFSRIQKSTQRMIKKKAEKAAKKKAARAAAKTTKATGKLSIRLAQATVKAGTALLKGLAALVASAPVVCVIVVVVILLLILLLPLFGTDGIGDNNYDILMSIMEDIEGAQNDHITALTDGYEPDAIQISHVGDYDVNRQDGWPAVYAVFLTQVYSTEGVLSMNEAQCEKLKDIYYHMTTITQNIEDSKITITISHMSATDAAWDYGFDDSQISMMQDFLHIAPTILPEIGTGGTASTVPPANWSYSIGLPVNTYHLCSGNFLFFSALCRSSAPQDWQIYISASRLLAL